MLLLTSVSAGITNYLYFYVWVFHYNLGTAEDRVFKMMWLGSKMGHMTMTHFKTISVNL